MRTNPPIYGRARAADAFVTGLLTLTGLPLNNETVTIGAKAYKFQTTLTETDGNVLIGATAAASIANLVAAITLGASAGVKYAVAMTAHTTATAAGGPSGDDTMVAKALTAGVTGNAIASTETLTNGSWGATKLDTVYVSLSMEEFERASLHSLLECAAGTVTATLEGSIRDFPNPEDIPAAEWDDITQSVFGVASLIAAATAATDVWVDNTGKLGGFRHIREKIQVATTATAVDWMINHKRW